MRVEIVLVSKSRDILGIVSLGLVESIKVGVEVGGSSEGNPEGC